jgi:hypothetical protein
MHISNAAAVVMVMMTLSCAPVPEPISSLIFFKLQSSGPWICGCACGRLEQMVNLNAAGFLAYTDDQIWCLAAAICLHCTDNHLSALFAHLIMYAWWF